MVIFLYFLPHNIHNLFGGKNIRRLNVEYECEDCYEPGRIAKGINVDFYIGIYAKDDEIVVSIMLYSL